VVWHPPSLFLDKLRAEIEDDAKTIRDSVQLFIVDTFEDMKKQNEKLIQLLTESRNGTKTLVKPMRLI
jgi:hypothetical protein